MNSPQNESALLTLDNMRDYLSSSLSSMNRNKLNGLLAEIDFRNYVSQIGFADRVSEGGWITRCDARSDLNFSQNTVVFFPETIRPDEPYSTDRELPEPHRRLHTICSTFYQIGIRSYFCAGRLFSSSNRIEVKWYATELGRPDAQGYSEFPSCITGFNLRQRRYNFLHYQNDVSAIPVGAIPTEFSKESLRVSFCNRFYSEISDVDGIFWGRQHTYPIEIKEKTRATGDRNVGDFFGLDVGPFVKLAYYAAKRGNLHSMFVVREIDNENDRNLVAWRYITFNHLAQYASWVFRAGGRSMTGGRSATVRIPVDQFQVLNASALRSL